MIKSLINKLFQKKQLYTLGMVEGVDLLEHLNLFIKLISLLVSMNVKVEEEDKMLLILASHPQSYEHLVTTLLYARDTFETEDVMETLLLNKMRNKPNMKELQVGGLCDLGWKSMMRQILEGQI